MAGRRDFYHQDLVWQDIQGPVIGINPPGLASDPALETDLALLPGSRLFSPTIENVMVRSVQLFHGHAETTLHPHIHYQRVAAGSGGICWQMKHRIIGNVGDTMGDWTEWETLTDVGSGEVESVHRVKAYRRIELDGLHDSAIVWLLLRRNPADPTDTYAENARLMFWDDHIQVGAAGSETEFPEA